MSLIRVKAGPYHLSGVSVGGLYTSIYVEELGVLFDVGMALRSHVGARALLLSHCHADHIGAYQTFLGLRGLSRLPLPPTYLPNEFLDDFRDGIMTLNRRKSGRLSLNLEGVSPGQRSHLPGGLQFEAFRTEHSVPSLGYRLFRRVEKLKEQFLHLSGNEIRDRKNSGDELFVSQERTEVVYATDTRIDIFDRRPELAQTKLLILEATFLDQELRAEEARSRYHVHLEDIIAREEIFSCTDAICLMHFSQFYPPHRVRQILQQRLPASLLDKIIPFSPRNGPWPG